MWSHPGKKLIFMGGEFAQWREWNHDAGLDWFLLDNPMHTGMQSTVADLNAAYRSSAALYARDADPAGFRWVVMDDADQSVFAYLRFGGEGDAPALVVCNFTPVPRHAYRVGVPQGGQWREIINTDAAFYGGSNMGNGGVVCAEPVPCHDQACSLVLTLPPLATLILLAT
jgi:1,4-alpha-glucan branching enzyme